MDIKNNILAFLLIGLVIVLTPYYLALFEPASLDKPSVLTVPEKKGLVLNSFDSSPIKTSNSIDSFDEIITSERIVYIETENYIAGISNKSGGSFHSFVLKNYSGGYYNNNYNKNIPVELIFPNLNNCSPCLSVRSDILDSGLLYFNDFFTLLNEVENDTIFLYDNDSFKLRFEFNHQNNYKINKSVLFTGNTYSFLHSFVLESNNFGFSDLISINWNDGIMSTEEYEHEDVNNSSVIINQAGNVDHYYENGKGSVPPVVLNGESLWVGIKNKYFLMAILPDFPGTSASYLYDNASLGNRKITPKYSTSIDFPVENNKFSFNLYFGPQDYSLLSSFDNNLQGSMTLGWKIIQPFSKGVLYLLSYLYKYLKNYGLVLIVFSLLIRILTGPLTKKAAVSSQKMQKIQPEMKKVHEKYKNDPQKKNQKTILLYKKHGVNPLSGCLPVLIQMPLLFALFTVFRTTIEFRGAPFIFWITDLSKPDMIFQLPFSLPLYGNNVCVLPIIMGITMFIQQRFSMASSDNAQKIPMYFMSGMFFLIFNTFPSGLNLYYSLSNILNIIQQQSIKKTLAR